MEKESDSLAKSKSPLAVRGLLVLLVAVAAYGAFTLGAWFGHVSL